MNRFTVCVSVLILTFLAGCENPSSSAMSQKDAEGRNIIVDPTSGKIQVIDQAGNVAKVYNQATDAGGGRGDHKGH